MGTEEMQGVQPPEEMGSRNEWDSKTVYTDALLRELAARWPRKICDCLGCGEPIYQGKAANPYHCCARHRVAIHASQLHQRSVLLHRLRQSGCEEEAKLVEQACPIRVMRRPRPKPMLKLRCHSCARTFSRAKSEVEKNQRRGYRHVYCSNACVGADLRGDWVTLTCARCGAEFIRSRRRVEYAKKLGCTRTFCGACTQNPYVTLTCHRCHTTFQRLWSLNNNGVGGQRSRVLCAACHRERRTPVTLTCQHCGQTFRRKRYQFERAIKLGRRRFFCTQCRHKARVRNRMGNFHLSPPVIITCAQCGRKFPRPGWRVKEAKSIGRTRSLCPTCQPAPPDRRSR